MFLPCSGRIFKTAAENPRNQSSYILPKLDTSWTRFERSEPKALYGLVNHSMTIGVALSLRNWMKSDVEDPFGVPRKALTLDGFQPVPSGWHSSLGGDGWKPVDLTRPPNRTTERVGFDLYSDSRSIHADEVAGLQSIAGYEGLGTRVDVVDMPLHPTFFDFIPGGEQAYDERMQPVYGAARDAGLAVISRRDLPQLPTEYWVDRNHLNGQGAKVLGQWLGSRLSNAEQ